MDMCPSGSPPHVRPSAKCVAGTTPNGIDGVDGVDRDTWIRMSGDVLGMHRQSKKGSVMDVSSSQEKLVL